MSENKKWISTKINGQATYIFTNKTVKEYLDTIKESKREHHNEIDIFLTKDIPYTI